MAKVKLLIDTDIFIDYFNNGFFDEILENKGFEVYYSVVTKKELLAKQGLKDSERQAILDRHSRSPQAGSHGSTSSS